jgi:hypothetical protein
VQNVPGPGRGRYGRPRCSRNPLRPTLDSTTGWTSTGRSSRSRAVLSGNGTSKSGMLYGKFSH